MTTTYDEEAIDQLRSTIAVTKPQLAKLARFLLAGSARLSGGLRAETGFGSSSPGNHAVMFSLDKAVPFTMPWRDDRGQKDHGDQRLTATGVAISADGVHLLAMFSPLVGNDTTKEITNAPRSTRWVPIDDVARIEQAI